MPWKECSKVEQRGEFVSLARVEGANVSQLCERFGISRKTGHKWLRRFGSKKSLADRSRRAPNTRSQERGAGGGECRGFENQPRAGGAGSTGTRESSLEEVSDWPFECSCAVVSGERDDSS